MQLYDERGKLEAVLRVRAVIRIRTGGRAVLRHGGLQFSASAQFSARANGGDVGGEAKISGGSMGCL